MDFNTMGIVADVIKYFIPFLFALCFHEFAHGWVARRKGDHTAEMMGRLTLNPMAHADVLGTFVLPLSAILFHIPFFGWAKPVPVNARNLRHPKEDMFWIALAGPLSNVLLAVIGALIFALVLFFARTTVPEGIVEMIKVFVVINLFLAAFNMIPIYPLDGAKVLEPFLPRRWNMWMEQNQVMLSFILLGLFLIHGLDFLAAPVYWTAQNLLMFGAHVVHFFA